MGKLKHWEVEKPGKDALFIKRQKWDLHQSFIFRNHALTTRVFDFYRSKRKRGGVSTIPHCPYQLEKFFFFKFWNSVKLWSFIFKCNSCVSKIGLKIGRLKIDKSNVKYIASSGEDYLDIAQTLKWIFCHFCAYNWASYKCDMVLKLVTLH